FARPPGSVAWSKNLGVDFAAAASLPDGSLIIAGSYSGAPAFAEALRPVERPEGFIAELDSAGSVRWARAFDGVSFQAVAASAEGRLVVAGSGGRSEALGRVSDAGGAFIARLNRDGSAASVVELGFSTPVSELAISPGGEIAAAGGGVGP